MFLGKVIGRVWSTKKVFNIEKYKILEVAPLDINMDVGNSVVSAIDVLGAGKNDIVICVGGSAARKWLGSDDISFENAIIGIVDDVYMDKELIAEIFFKPNEV